MIKASILLFALFLGIISGIAQNYQWAKNMGGNGDDGGNSITVDGSGNVYTTGFFGGTVDFDPGAGISNLTSAGYSDIFITKLDAAGNFIWAKRMGGNGEDQGNCITVDDSGNVYTTGRFWGTVDFDPGAGTSNLTSAGFSDIYISKLDSAGNFIWAKSMGGTDYDISFSITLDDSSNVYTTGTFWYTVDFDPGAGTSNLTSAAFQDIFISKLDAAGNFIWAKSMGGTSPDLGISIAVDGAGNVYTTGHFSGTVDFDPGTGTSNLTSAGFKDIFISKLDAAGNFVWARNMGGPNSDDVAYSITVDGIGNVLTTGSFHGTADFDPGPGVSNLTSAGGNLDIFISKLDAAGNFIWAKSMDGPNSSDIAYSIAVDSFSNVYTTGIFYGTVDFDPGAGISNLTSAGFADIFISKLDSVGNFGWAKKLGGISNDIGYSIALNGFGNVYTTGQFMGTVDFDPGVGTSNLTSAGSTDIFVLKLGAISVSILESSFDNTIMVYPNPTKGSFNIDLGTNIENTTIVIRNLVGQEVLKKSYRSTNLLDLNIAGESGLYFIEVISDNKKAILKVVKN